MAMAALGNEREEEKPDLREDSRQFSDWFLMCEDVRGYKDPQDALIALLNKQGQNIEALFAAIYPREQTPLMKAAQYGWPRVVAFLLEKSQDAHADCVEESKASDPFSYPTTEKYTPLDFAMRYIGGLANWHDRRIYPAKACAKEIREAANANIKRYTECIARLVGELDITKESDSRILKDALMVLVSSRGYEPLAYEEAGGEYIYIDALEYLMKNVPQIITLLKTGKDCVKDLVVASLSERRPCVDFAATLIIAANKHCDFKITVEDLVRWFPKGFTLEYSLVNVKIEDTKLLQTLMVESGLAKTVKRASEMIEKQIARQSAKQSARARRDEEDKEEEDTSPKRLQTKKIKGSLGTVVNAGFWQQPVLSAQPSAPVPKEVVPEEVDKQALPPVPKRPYVSLGGNKAGDSPALNPR